MMYDHVDASDVGQFESLRQSELVKRLVHRVQEDLSHLDTVVPSLDLSCSITMWLQDNGLVIKSR